MKTNFFNTSLKVRANHIAFLCENLNKTIKEIKHEHIPEASDTSGWEIAADAVIVPVAAGRQEYQRMYGRKFARKAIGFLDENTKPDWTHMPIPCYNL